MFKKQFVDKEKNENGATQGDEKKESWFTILDLLLFFKQSAHFEENHSSQTLLWNIHTTENK